LDVLDDFAAVLVVPRRRDGFWMLDIVRCLNINGEWFDSGSGGASNGDLPLGWDRRADPEVAVVTTSVWTDGERSFACAGGFVTGAVSAVELVTAVGIRRVGMNVHPAFALVARSPMDGEISSRRHQRELGLVIRALTPPATSSTTQPNGGGHHPGLASGTRWPRAVALR
jgi:hypothetical protein